MPPSPTRARRSTTNGDLPSFMRRPPKPEGVKTILASASINNLTPSELEERYRHNERILAETSASSSHFIKQLEDQQSAIRARLNDLGVESIRSQLEHTKINEDESMTVDPSPPPPPQLEEYRPIGAKARALARWNPTGPRGAPAGGMSYDEAANILRESYQREQEHKARMNDRRRRRGDVVPGEQLTRAEMDARMLAFLTYKPTDSDLEDDDEEDEDEEEEGRPAWFDEDDQDDGIKGQDIVEPDYEDLSTIIRIDEARIPWAIPREE
ncbi:hypothetical protein DICSQDRAFT_174726 [Dichomitus squalens LYAD-421 SS1]|uniref:Uncharacterized protein n=1 Tax=Dichomitus squalens (strain LYAD-421) TaxID=732165 RepID=R7SNM5_DICSQ|nr:uncharacterized protein DICSQDRAFT_174726 [Dichomitus squalens LYAD-421 SS1]EJF56587.1 hypothetical protein DICSQDRAFT_174726 [Dichomitus squalens LYAD-421 SS1]